MEMQMLEGFQPLALCAFGLILNLGFLSGYTGAVRARTKTPAIADDAKLTGAEYKEEVPLELQRVLNAHRNALENIPGFLIIALLYMMSGASATMMWVFGGLFLVARWSHSFCYIKGLQPWRSASYGVGTLALMAMSIHLVMRAL